MDQGSSSPKRIKPGSVANCIEPSAIHSLDHLGQWMAVSLAIYGITLPALALTAYPLAEFLGSFTVLHGTVLFLTILFSVCSLVTGYIEHQDRQMTILGVLGASCLLLAFQPGENCCSPVIASFGGQVASEQLSAGDYILFLLPIAGGIFAAKAFHRNATVRRRLIRYAASHAYGRTKRT